MFAVALYVLYFYLVILLYQNQKWRTFGLDNSKIIIWGFIFLFVLFLGCFVLFFLFQIKKRVKKQKTKKYIQIIIYGCSVIWACGIFYTRLHPVPFFNKGFNKTESLVRIIHEKLKKGKNFSTIYKKNEKALKHFDSIDVNTKSAGNFQFSTNTSSRKSTKKLASDKTFKTEFLDFLDFLNPKFHLAIYQKRSNDSVFGSAGKVVNEKDVSIFIQHGSSKCFFYMEKKDLKGYLVCIDMF